MADEKLYTQKDLDFLADNADEYFEMTITLRKMIQELRDALALERGGGTPLSRSHYLLLHKRSGELL